MQSAATYISVQPEQVEQQQQHIGILTVRLPQKMLNGCILSVAQRQLLWCLFCWNYFKKPLDNKLKTTAPPKQRPTLSGVNCCARCGMWFKMKHGKTTCDVNRPKDLVRYDFEVPERLRKTLVPSVAPVALAHQPEEEFVDSQTGRLSSLVSLSLTRSFHLLGTFQSLCCQEKQEHHSLPCERPYFTYPDWEEWCNWRPVYPPQTHPPQTHPP